MEEGSDGWVMDRIKAGKIGELRVLFDRYTPRLASFFLRLCGNRDASEDMVQEVFYRILKFRKTYRNSADLPPWIFTVARNVWIDRCRNEKPHLSLDAVGTEIDSRDEHTARVLARGQEMARIRRALHMLPPDQRAVLILSRFEDLRYEQIATILGCEVGTVKSRVHRALRQLREAYEELSQVRTS